MRADCSFQMAEGQENTISSITQTASETYSTPLTFTAQGGVRYKMRGGANESQFKIHQNSITQTVRLV